MLFTHPLICVMVKRVNPTHFAPTKDSAEHAVIQERIEDLKQLLKTLEEHVSKSKDEVDSMFNTSLTSHQEKIHPLVKKEGKDLSRKLKEFANTFSAVVSVGEHTAAVKDAVLAAVLVLNDTAVSLEHTGDDLIQQNIKYYEAVSKLMQEVKKILDLGPCDKVVLALKKTLFELKYDVDHYQWEIHNEMGFKKPDLRVHINHGAISEESKESSEEL